MTQFEYFFFVVFCGFVYSESAYLKSASDTNFVILHLLSNASENKGR